MREFDSGGRFSIGCLCQELHVQQKLDHFEKVSDFLIHLH